MKLVEKFTNVVLAMRKELEIEEKELHVLNDSDDEDLLYDLPTYSEVDKYGYYITYAILSFKDDKAILQGLYECSESKVVSLKNFNSDEVMDLYKFIKQI